MKATMKVYGLLRAGKYLATEIVGSWFKKNEEKIILFKSYEEALNYQRNMNVSIALNYKIKEMRIEFDV